MRIAFLSPLPPAKSGIADYSEALLAELSRLADVSVFVNGDSFQPDGFDAAIYQVGNNPDHAHAYRAALSHPGIVVLHEANLHHLIAEITIRPGDWDGYMREVEFEGGAPAIEYARRVRALEIGPDYDGLPMLRRLMERARGLIVHSQYVAEQARQAGYRGPVAVIPHGAWIPPVERMKGRLRLGLDISSPLVGIFGHLKPYKRIGQSLRAMRRLLRLLPEAKMILAGEPHPELALDQYLRDPLLSAAVRVLGHTPAEEFVDYIAACDVVLNLRYPTVGETSGTLLRALGAGKAVIVSDVGAFREFPDDICLKAPIGEGEEELLFQYLNLLFSRPELAKAMSERARAWVSRECSWALAAKRYLAFAEAVAEDCEWPGATAPAASVEPAQPGLVGEDYLVSWAGSQEGAREYIETHLNRFQKTLAVTPPGGPSDRILEMGAYMQITPALHSQLGYGEVRGCYYGPAGRTDHKVAVSETGERFECDVDLFDAERDPFPYPDGHFTTVLCCELLEHLTADPMHMMSEINRVLKPDGWLVLTTPNIASLRALAAAMQGLHPGFFPAYVRPLAAGAETDARHNREYTPKEVYRLLHDAGFQITLLETGPFRERPEPEHLWVDRLLELAGLDRSLRGDGIYIVGRKAGPPRERFPSWLYS